MNCGCTVLTSVRIKEYSSTPVGIGARTWQLNANHYLNFLAGFPWIGSAHAHNLTAGSCWQCSDSWSAFTAALLPKPPFDPAASRPEAEWQPAAKTSTATRATLLLMFGRTFYIITAIWKPRCPVVFAYSLILNLPKKEPVLNKFPPQTLVTTGWNGFSFARLKDKPNNLVS